MIWDTHTSTLILCLINIYRISHYIPLHPIRCYFHIVDYSLLIHHSTYAWLYPPVATNLAKRKNPMENQPFMDDVPIIKPPLSLGKSYIYG